VSKGNRPKGHGRLVGAVALVGLVAVAIVGAVYVTRDADDPVDSARTPVTQVVDRSTGVQSEQTQSTTLPSTFCDAVESIDAHISASQSLRAQSTAESGKDAIDLIQQGESELRAAGDEFVRLVENAPWQVKSEMQSVQTGLRSGGADAVTFAKAARRVNELLGSDCHLQFDIAQMRGVDAEYMRSKASGD
jgi:hypothetical protein